MCVFAGGWGGLEVVDDVGVEERDVVGVLGEDIVLERCRCGLRVCLSGCEIGDMWKCGLGWMSLGVRRDCSFMLLMGLFLLYPWFAFRVMSESTLVLYRFYIDEKINLN